MSSSLVVQETSDLAERSGHLMPVDVWQCHLRADGLTLKMSTGADVRNAITDSTFTLSHFDVQTLINTIMKFITSFAHQAVGWMDYAVMGTYGVVGGFGWW